MEKFEAEKKLVEDPKARKARERGGKRRFWEKQQQQSEERQMLLDRVQDKHSKNPTPESEKEFIEMQL